MNVMNWIMNKIIIRERVWSSTEVNIENPVCGILSIPIENIGNKIPLANINIETTHNNTYLYFKSKYITPSIVIIIGVIIGVIIVNANIMILPLDSRLVLLCKNIKAESDTTE